ncbi:TALPID3 protein, partial [Aplysia californica]|uniref:TALPID3 protein n=1 Tax=Aplysia californica TaxID=6500 RepID=A0ABM0K7D8_APLCA
MSVKSLDELVNVTGNAVMSLDRSGSSSGVSEKILTQFVGSAGSPFESPRSQSSHKSSQKEFKSKDSGIEKSGSKVTEVEKKTAQTSMENDNHDTSEDVTENDIQNSRENATVIEITPMPQGDRFFPSHQSFPRGLESHAKKGSDDTGKQDSNHSQEIDCAKSHSDIIVDDLDSKKNQTRFMSQQRHIRIERHGEFTSSFQHANSKASQEASSGGKNFVEEDRFSASDEQPEIIDVHEQVVMTSGMSETSENDSTENVIDTVIEANHPLARGSEERMDTIFKAHSAHGLKQGALSRGSVDPTKARVFDDVYISQFGLSDRQRDLKEALGKRSQNSKPRKKIVQPHIVGSQTGSETDSDFGMDQVTARTRGAVDETAATAAVAASAAVAATQPFIKAQQELESRMQQLLSQLGGLQEQKDLSAPAGLSSGGGDSRVDDLERQVKELNERRLEHLETLQQQQLQMQAQLLMMSRSKSPSDRMMGQSRRQVSPSRQFQSSRIPQAVTKRNNGVSLAQQQPALADPDVLFPYKSTVTPASKQQQPLMYSRDLMEKQRSYLNEVRELQGSHLDTPAPRQKVPTPTPYFLPENTRNNLGFLEELLAHKRTPERDTTFSVKGGYTPPSKLERDMNNSARTRRGDKSPVDQARKLMTSLTELEKETADSVWGPKGHGKDGYLMDVDLGPAPLEKYLKYPENTSSPYPKLGDARAEQKTSTRRSTSDKLAEAKKVLRQLETTRENLEENLAQVIRSRQDLHVFSTLLAPNHDGAPDERLKIERMVNRKIKSLQSDVQRDVLRGLAQREAEKIAAAEEVARQKLLAKKTVTSARYDNAKSGTLKLQAERSARLAYSKSAAVASTSVVPSRGKENRASKVKPPPKPVAIKDEKTMTRTYGKPEYQRGRTTIRDPYLHFQNTKKGVANRSVMNESAAVSPVGRGRSPGRSRSPRSGQNQGYGVTSTVPRQFYFSPTRGYIPLQEGAKAPIQGQLVSMAIPLGEPRLEPGVRQSATPIRPASNPVTSTPVPVTAARNVAMVSFPVEEDQNKTRTREPELAKQVLPPIDIDSISPSSSRRSDIQIRSPQQGNANVTFLQEVHDDDVDLDKTITEEDSDLDQTGEGIQLPGYEPRVAEYSGPSFPPKTGKSGPDWMAGGEQMQPPQQISDVMAEDLRRKDVLENNAVYWLEQELMARVLTEVMPIQVAQSAPLEAANISKAGSVHSEEASEREDSLLVADMIGHGGLQLFIDAGQPVDNNLVSALVKEVIQERVNSMLAQRPAEGADAVRAKEEIETVLKEKEREAGTPQIPTPEPTPKTSPIPSPRRLKQHATAPTTPPISPPPTGHVFSQRVEPEPLVEPVRAPAPAAAKPRSPPPQPEPEPEAVPTAPPAAVDYESESSVSIDISEELRRVAASGKPKHEEDLPLVQRHDVATPPISPPPMDEEEVQVPAPVSQRQATPPLSPQSVVSREPLPPSSPSKTQAPAPVESKAEKEAEQEEEEEEEEQEEETEEE